jgi:hypothetical protein
MEKEWFGNLVENDRYQTNNTLFPDYFILNYIIISKNICYKKKIENTKMMINDKEQRGKQLFEFLSHEL